MNALRSAVAAVDGWQRRRPVIGATYGVVKKFGDDNANLLVVSLAWYGFTAIFPLLLVLVTVLGFVGEKSLGTGLVSTLHNFPVVGSSFNPAGGSQLHGSTLGLVVGLVGLVYGAQGVTQNAQQAMATVWNIPVADRPGFLPRLARSLLGLFTIGGAFVVNAFASTYATGGGEPFGVRVGVIAGLIALNVCLYFAAFTILTPKQVPLGSLLPGAIAGAVAFTLLITVGTGLITHQLKSASNTYGTFGGVIGLVTFLLLLAKLSLYAAELNPVLARRLYPRALPTAEPTDADRRVDYDLAQQQRRRDDQRIAVGFGPDSSAEAALDALRGTEQQPGDSERQPSDGERQPSDGQRQPGSGKKQRDRAGEKRR